MSKRVGNFYQYSGAVHMHTTESDGTKVLEDVVALGREVKLDFMMFTDHMTLSNRDAGKEGFYGNTLVVVGYEHNDLDDHHHYLLFDSPAVYPETMTASEYVAEGSSDNALGILAHPDEIRDRMAQFPPYPWKDWSEDSFDGIEIWNQMSEWMERLTPFNKLAMALSPRKSMIGPTDRILKKWDELNMYRKVAGVAGVDAHAFPIKVGPMTVEIFPYKVHFRCLRTHILLDEPLSKDFDRAKNQLYTAIRECRLFFSNMRWGNADKSQFTLTDGVNTVTCGGSVKYGDHVTLSVNLPSRATVKIVHNGETILTTKTNMLDYRVQQSGIYRVEAWKGRRGWVFSNHFRVEPEGE